MIVHAIALVLDVVLFLSLFTSAQRVLVVSVGREGEELALKFSPEVVYANVGDQVQFQFYPLVGICSLSRKVCYRDCNMVAVRLTDWQYRIIRLCRRSLKDPAFL